MLLMQNKRLVVDFLRRPREVGVVAIKPRLTRCPVFCCRVSFVIIRKVSKYLDRARVSLVKATEFFAICLRKYFERSRRLPLHIYFSSRYFDNGDVC